MCRTLGVERASAELKVHGIELNDDSLKVTAMASLSVPSQKLRN
jgi:hypothetical protein